MADSDKYWKLTIKGPSIQGVMLREAIVSIKTDGELASSLKGVTGFVRNFQDWVEVIFKASKPQADELLNAIRKIPNNPESMEIVKYDGEPKLEEIPSPESIFPPGDFSDFKVKRDSEEKEMMLALQGAGKVFKHSAEIQQKVSNQLKERDEKKVIGLLLSLFFESTENRDAISGKAPIRISLTAMEQAIAAPPIPTETFVFQLSEAFSKINQYKREVTGKSDAERNSIIKTIEGFRGTLKKELEQRDIKVE